MTFNEDQARDERGRWSSVGVDHVALAEKIAGALAGRADRLTHGHTAKTGFILHGGEVHQWNQAPWGKQALMGATSVHSHIPVGDSGALLREGTFSGGDIESYIKLARTEGIRQHAVITSDRTMDVLEFPKSGVDVSVYKLGAKKLSGMLEGDYATRSAYQPKGATSHNREGKSAEFHREKMRAFAKRYGLAYHEDVPWGKR